jgi:tetratricopeptide (TPR) repeat protein
MASKKRRKPVVKLDSRRKSTAHSQRVSLQKSEALARSAREAWERHQYEQTIALYEQALRRDPKNHFLLIDLARAYGLRYRLDEAETMLDRVLRLYPRSAKVRSMAAATFAMIQRPAKAIEHYRHALELDHQHPESAAIHTELARLCEQSRDLDSARESADRAVALAPNKPEAIYIQALLQIRQRETAIGCDQLRSLAEREGVADQIRSDAWYELARVYDRDGDFDAAFDAATKAKRLLAPQAQRFQNEAAFLRNRHQTMLAALVPEHFRRWKDAASASPPRSIALLTGHPRSGTTLLEQVLDGHSQLVSADEFMVMGEHVFRPLAAVMPGRIPTPDSLDAIPTERLVELRRQYWQMTEALLGEPIGSRMLLDKNPSLSYLLPVICRVFPEIKVLFALRDPRDVVVSCFMQRMPVNAISSNYLSLEATVAKYADVMNYWLTIRPMMACEWREVRYEDTVADLPAQARGALEFVGLSWEESVLDFHVRAQRKLVRSPTAQDVTQPVYSRAVGRWQNYVKYLEPLLGMLEPYLKAFGYS